MKNNYICHVPYLRNSIAYDHNLCYLLSNDDTCRCFFSVFSKFWFFELLWGKCIKKRVQNNKKFCVMLHISRTITLYGYYRLLFMVHFCKMIISPSVSFIFHFFEILIFPGVRGSKRVKSSLKWQKNSVHQASYLRDHVSYDCNLWYTCKMIIPLSVCSCFSSFLSVLFKNKPQTCV